jgi:hypothetical protein
VDTSSTATSSASVLDRVWLQKYAVFSLGFSPNQLNPQQQTNQQLLELGHFRFPNHREVLKHAIYVLSQLCSESKWHGQDQNKATFPTFKSPQAASASVSKVKCHKCGGDHYLRDCPDPKRIKAGLTLIRRK